ncbi:MAG: protein kinase [bacterium]|nr:protein kinase [bacterium]
MTCAQCSTVLPADARYCPSCGQDSHVPAASSSATQTSVPDRPTAVFDPSDASGGGAADEPRFSPGTILAERYRIVGLLGRGGMGEVYRADDLKLARTVALKFLPEAMERDPGRLARFLNEARVAARVTHPNVCRVHDIADMDGRHFISMEYVDGEDLATLLQRVDRLPGDRAVRAARQLCAGLTAAHREGVLHRDLKPANVMIDGRGDVKITDFGLAGAAGGFAGAEIKVGTPAYMAPEQLAGSEVTAQSDIYALGLVLYEMFSGRPAFDDPTPEGIAKRSTSQPRSLTSQLGDVDPAVSRVVDRCLIAEPGQRPASAMAVAAALPGGDPLAAALAAGETPSPELIAEAGAGGGLRPPVAALLLLAIVVGMLGTAWVTSRLSLISRVGLQRPPAVLLDRAESMVEQFGWAEGLVDSTHSWNPHWSFYQHVRRSEKGMQRWESFGGTRPAGIHFYYRAGPDELARRSKGSIGNWMGDPPPSRAGMVEIELDPAGRLAAFRGTPDSFEIRDTVTGENGAPAEFDEFFAAAGLDPLTFSVAEPVTRPRNFGDRRYAWTGRYPELFVGEPVEIRIEAASLRGRPISFVVFEPWDLPTAEPETFPPTFWDRAANLLGPLWFAVAVLGVTLLAVRNMRLGRGDHRSALRFGLYLAAVRLLWIVGARFGGNPLDTVIAHVAWSAYRFVLSYVFYMALEPYARRLWPEMLVSWVRLASFRFRDARVGRDLAIGVAAGCAFALASDLVYWISLLIEPSNDGLSDVFWSWEALRGPRSALAAVAGLHVSSVLFNLTGLMLFLVARMICGSDRIAIGITTVLALVMFNPGEIFSPSYLISFAIIVTLFWVVLFRAGLLAFMLAFTVDDVLTGVRVTADLGAWHAVPMWLAYGSVLAVALWGVSATQVGRPLFRDEIREG